MLGNRKYTRKDMRCLLIDKVVDLDVTNIKDLMESIAVECPPGYLLHIFNIMMNQCKHFQK